MFISFISHLLLACAIRDDFYQILLFFSAAFVCYMLICTEYSLKQILIMAVAFRVIWLFVTPELSDDYNRFLWDGEMISQMQNPYKEIPSNLIDLPQFNNEVTEQLYSEMNSKDYYTVYPPTNQMMFLVSALGGSVKSRLIILKIFFFLLEFLGLYALYRLAKSKRLNELKFGLWSINPLVIAEGVGNLHFEVIVLTFLILAFVFYQKNWWFSAVFFGLAISTKLLPLMFLPLLIPAIGWKKSFLYGLVSVGVFLLSFVPFFDLELARNLWSSIDLYFQNFEFNASIFYIVKWIGELIVGWDIVRTAGPIMASITVLVIAYLSFIPRKPKTYHLAEAALIANTVYLLLSTTVHPWYILMPLGISVFTRFKYAMWWSGLVFFSYSFYLNGGIEEKPLWLFLEYGILLVIIFLELRHKKFMMFQRVEVLEKINS